jgi:hypothetical protein
VNRTDILAFVRREWSLAAEQKAAFWAEHKRTISAAEAVRLGDELRRHARLVQPTWPDAAERADDLAVHIRVSEALRAVSRHRAR